MKKVMKCFVCFCSILLLSLVTVIDTAVATQPRITPGLLSPEKLEIFTYEDPPLASLDIPSGGLYPDIIRAALKKENIDVTITILPIKSLVKFNLLLDNAVGIIGEGWALSEQERNRLIFLPFGIIQAGYYYYRPAHERELSLNGNLANLKEYTYGAQKGDDITAFKEAGISIRYGSILSHYKNLKSKKIDFISAPDISKEWIVSKYFPEDINSYLRIKDASWEVPSTIIFNKDNIEAEAVARKFGQGLIKIKQDGTYIDILENYLGQGNAPEDYFLRLERYQKEAELLNRWSQ